MTLYVVTELLYPILIKVICSSFQQEESANRFVAHTLYSRSETYPTLCFRLREEY